MRKWTDEQLIRAVKDSKCCAEALRLLGLRHNGGSYKTVRRHLDRLGLDTSHWNYRPPVLRDPVPLEEILVEGSSYSRRSLKRRLVDEGLLDYRCRVCGIDEWQGQPLILQLDHKNGVGNDNRLENLRLLCPNCHSQTETFAGRNNTRIRQCVDCENRITAGHKRCVPCSNRAKSRSKISWPESSDLFRMVASSSYEAVGRTLGVTGAAVKKRLKTHPAQKHP